MADASEVLPECECPTRATLRMLAPSYVFTQDSLPEKRDESYSNRRATGRVSAVSQRRSSPAARTSLCPYSPRLPMRQTGQPRAASPSLRRSRLAGHHAGLRMVMQEQTNDASTRGLGVSMRVKKAQITYSYAFWRYA